MRSATFPPSFEAWAREFRRGVDLSTWRCRMSAKPLLIVHGDDDESVSQLTVFAGQAHGVAELRIVAGAGHRLRHDPRAVAILLGWLDRERNRVTTIR